MAGCGFRQCLHEPKRIAKPEYPSSDVATISTIQEYLLLGKSYLGCDGSRCVWLWLWLNLPLQVMRDGMDSLGRDRKSSPQGIFEDHSHDCNNTQIRDEEVYYIINVLRSAVNYCC